MYACLSTTPAFENHPRTQLLPFVVVVFLVHLVAYLGITSLLTRPVKETPVILETTFEISAPALETPKQNLSAPPRLPPPPTAPRAPEAAPVVASPAPAPALKTEPAAQPQPLPPPLPTPVLPAAEAPAPVIQPLFKLSKMPGFTRRSEAVYPPAERRAGVQATVLVEVTLDHQGKILTLRILKSGGAAFDEAVKTALQQSEFSPGLMDEKPVGTRFQVPYRFNLN